MKFQSLFLRLRDAAVLVGILAYSVAEEDLIYAAVALPLVVLAAVVTGGPQGSPLPRWLINTALLAATGFMISSWFKDLGETISVLCHYVIWLQLIKLFEPRTQRDQAQILVLSAMLVLGACLTSVKPDLGGMLLLYIPLMITTVVVFQVVAGQVDVGAAIAFGHRSGAHLRRIITVSGLMVIASAIVVFVATPRGFGESFVSGWRGPAPKPIIGFRDHVQLGAQGLLSESPVVVMEMRVQSSLSNEPYARPILLRGAVLNEYDPQLRLWRRGGPLRGAQKRKMWTPGDEPPQLRRDREYLTQHITAIEQPSELFCAWKPVHVSFEKSGRKAPYHFNDAAGLLDLRLTTWIGAYSYTVISDPAEMVVLRPPSRDERSDTARLTPRGARQPWSLATGWRYCPAPSEEEILRNPFTDGPVRQLAESILAERGIDLRSSDGDAAERAAAAFRTHLQQHYRYTTQMVAPLPDQDPIEMFLFDTGPDGRGGRGHCEYFSSAFVAMCLSVNIPARVVTGYAASEFDAASGRYTIRQNHAHAWADVELAPGRWREFDPSPSADLHRLHQPPPGFMTKARRILDALQFAWIRSVVSFDRNSQTAAFRSAGESPGHALSRLNDEIAERIGEGAAPDDSESPTISAARVFASVLVASTILALIILGLFARGGAVIRALCRLLHIRPPRLIERLVDPGTRELVRLRRQMEAALARRQFRPEPAAPPLTFALAVARIDPALGDDVVALTQLYYRAHYGAQAPSRETIAAARSHLRRIRDRLAGR